ncbi:DUF1800 domain-containing protein [Kitasatospora sp. NPDC049258]|uniref:DUF1800 domain-containing protein n=1 Tax=Kitasatospora sp. NPDC049258 TaxID=3155394 RepID=UPI00341C5ADE
MAGPGAPAAGGGQAMGGSSRPAGNQPALARTYADRDASLMGSRAGQQLRPSSPVPGKTYSGPGAAATASKAGTTTVLADDPVLHLARRFTMGPTPALVAEIRAAGIDRWISRQLAPNSIPLTQGERMAESMPTRGKAPGELVITREDRKTGELPDLEAILATTAKQLWSDRQMFEVMVDFWNDLLHVADPHPGIVATRASFDTDVIRKYALDNYPDMFLAANRHPALLAYLSQDQSGKDAVNENLARENLELFTVGVDGGYTEADVRQAALLQTGRQIRGQEFFYNERVHYVGAVEIMGFKHPNASAAGGLEAGDAYLRHLAMHPSTALRVATQLCLQFVSDVPPKSLVDRLADTYLKNKGQVIPVLLALLSSSEFWASVGQKVRRPMEQLVATYRILDVQPGSQADLKPGLTGLYETMREFGQWPMGQPTPNGYPRVFVAWTSPGAMVSQWNEAGEVLAGARKEFRCTKPEELLAGQPPATAGAYLDALAERLVFGRLRTGDRAAVLRIAGVAEGDHVDASFNGSITAVARTILASPQHTLK